jgi:HK97 family phage major capsid protein
MSEVIRTSVELEKDKANLVAEADQLHSRTKSQDNPLTAEEEARLDELLNQAEALDKDIHHARRAERLVTEKGKLEAPARPAFQAPTATASMYAGEWQNTKQRKAEHEALNTWCRVVCGEQVSANEIFKCRSAGLDPAHNKLPLTLDWEGAKQRAIKQRTVMASNASGAGAEWVFQNYMDKVVDYLLVESTLLNYINVENVENANDYLVFNRDDTSVLGDYVTASSGTESNPTVPDNNVTSAQNIIKVMFLNSGYLKFTRQELNRSGVPIMETVARATAKALARKIEKDMLLAAAAGTSAIGGILQAGTEQVAGDTSLGGGGLTIPIMEDLVYSVPQQYRTGSVIVTSPTGEQKLYQIFKATTGQSLFERLPSDPPNVERLLGCPVIVSNWMDAYGTANNKPFLCFQPDFYKAVAVQNSGLELVREKFHPLIAAYQEAWFGGKWVGPNTAARFTKLVA